MDTKVGKMTVGQLILVVAVINLLGIGVMIALMNFQFNAQSGILDKVNSLVSSGHDLLSSINKITDQNQLLSNYSRALNLNAHKQLAENITELIHNDQKIFSQQEHDLKNLTQQLQIKTQAHQQIIDLLKNNQTKGLLR